LRLDRLVGVVLELLVQHSQADRGCLLQPYEHDHGGVRAATTASPIERDVVLVTQAGERRRLATTSIPLHDEAGALTGVTVLVSPAR
jgi:hypothetical protein